MQMVNIVFKSVKLDFKWKQNLFMCYLQEGQFKQNDRRNREDKLKEGIVTEFET